MSMDCHQDECASAAQTARRTSVNRAKVLAIATIGWNVLEGAVALYAGISSSSVALTGFGLDSAIETVSAGIVGHRFWSESSCASAESNKGLERRAARSVGVLLLLLACYVSVEAVRKLLGFGEQPRESRLGIALTTVALVVMPLLAWAKYKSARALNSKAMKAEAFQSFTCAWMAGATLLGLALNTLFHWSWADPLAALVFVPAIIKEGIEALKGELCTDCH